jgi:cold shock CspA family protein
MKQPFQSRTSAQICDESDVGTNAVGTIDTINLVKRYGFIRFGESKRIFFHFSEFPNALLHARSGVAVAFEVEQRAGKICAVRVRPHQEEGDGNHARHGVIKIVMADKSFGFVTDPAGGDLFFHRSNLADGIDLETLKSGDPVSYIIGRNHKGPIATEVGPR